MALNALRGTPKGSEDDLSEGMTCPGCGQWFAYADFGDVFYHDEPGHLPLPRRHH